MHLTRTFSVGAAALLANGVVVTGTNQENAAYPSGLCAERTTLFYANSQYPDQPVNDPRYRSKNRKGLYRNSYSSLWRLPPSDSGNGKTLRPAYPYICYMAGKCIYEVQSIGRFTTAVI